MHNMALTPEQLQAARAKYGIPNPSESQAQQRVMSMNEAWAAADEAAKQKLGDGLAGDFAGRAVNTLIKTGAGVESALDQTLGRGINIALGKGNVPTNTGQETRDFAEKVDVRSRGTLAGDAGELFGTAAQYLAGPGGAAKTAVGTTAKLLPKVGGFLARQAPEAAKDVAIGTLNTGDPVEGAIQGATAFLPVNAAKGAVGKAKEFVETTAERTAKDTEAFIRKLVTPEQTKGKTGVFTQNIGSGRVSEGTFTKGRDIAPDARQMAIEREVSTVPGIDPKKTQLENSNAIHEEIGNVAQKLESDLINRDVQAILTKDLWDGYIAGVEKEIADNPLLVGDASQTAHKILGKFKELLPKGQDITAKDILKARKDLDSWMRSIKGNAFDPKTENAVSIALRAVRQGANDLIEQTAEDVAVRQMLRRQSLLFDAVENIAPKAAKEGDTGFARLLKEYPFLKWAAPTVGASLVGGGIGGALVGRGLGGSE